MEKIEGIKLANSEVIVSQLADDTSIFLNSPEHIPYLLKILTKFALCSGLKTNVEKTKVHNIGHGDINKHQLSGMNLENGPIKLLGISLTNNEKENIEQNFLPKLKLMQNLLNLWSQRNLSLKGKITVINSLIVSLFVYQLTIIETPTKILDQIDDAIFKFLWGNKKPKIAKAVIQKQIKDGGLKMPNIYLKAKSWKTMWMKRAILQPENSWVKVLDETLGTILFKDFIKCNADTKTESFGKLPAFYQGILVDWYNIASDKIVTNSEIQNQVIWNNRLITIDKRTIFWINWYSKGVVHIRDILDANGEFMDHQSIKAKYGIKTNFLEVLQLRQS